MSQRDEYDGIKTFLFIFVVSLLLSLAADPSANAGPVFLGLGDLPGGQVSSRAFAVSADGTTVVGSSFSALGEEAFRWTFGDGMVGLGDFAGGDFRSVAFDVSRDGSFIVGGGTMDVGAEAFRWSAQSGMVGLGDIPGGRHGSTAFAVSADGAVIAGVGTSSILGEASRWTVESGMVGLGILPGGSSSIAFGISSDGSTIVGRSATDGGSLRAVRWTAEDGLQTFLPDNVFSWAIATTDDGSMILGTIFTDRRQGFLWSDELGLTILGNFRPRSLSDNGSIIVGEELFDSKLILQRAIIWDEFNGPRDLRNLLISDFGLDLAGWSLLSADDISADGRVIVGTGINPSGQLEGWVAVIPEPGTFLLMAIGCISFLCNRKR